jgi:hypothetical protein
VSRLVAVAALGIAVAALVVAVLATRTADHANDRLARVEEQAGVAGKLAGSASGQAEASERRLKRLAPSPRFALALCYSTRHAGFPARRNYATTIGISLVHLIVRDCDYAHVPNTG